jgi:hypothetical protein
VRLRGLLVLFGCACALTAPALAAAPPLAGASAVATLRAQNTAFNNRNFAGVWSAYTANYKAKCGPYSKWVKDITATRNQVPGPLTTRITGNKVVGAKAFLAYQLIAGGKVIATIKASSPDVYVRINGRWYDEYDHGC